MKHLFFIALVFCSLYCNSQERVDVYHHSAAQSNGLGIKYTPMAVAPTPPQPTVFTTPSNDHIAFYFDYYHVYQYDSSSLEKIKDKKVNKELVVDFDPKTRNIRYWIDNELTVLNFDGLVDPTEIDSSGMSNVTGRTNPKYSAQYTSPLGEDAEVIIYTEKKQDLYIIFLTGKNWTFIHGTKNYKGGIKY